MGLTKLSINRPLTILMAILALVLMGYIGYTYLNVDRMPRVDIPYVTVVVVYPGASPDDVSRDVVEKIEDAVAGVSGVKQITSKANENYGTVTLEFAEGTDGNQAAVDVSREIDAIKANLPADAEEPTIIKADLNATSLMQIVLSGPQGQDALYKLADEELKPRLQAVSGVASVNVAGGREQQVQINPSPIKMAAYNLSLSTLEQLLAAENATVPAGTLERGSGRSSLRAVGEFSSIADIESIVVAGRPSQLASMLPAGVLPQAPAGMDTGGLVHLRDVAAVSEGYADASQLVRYNGQQAVLITVVKTSDGNAIAVSDAVQAALALFEAEDLPANANLEVVIDATTFTRESVAAVQEDLLLAVLITGAIMLLFLHTINSSLIVMLSVPTSLIVTFLVMWWLGFSLNTMTLLALTLVIAIVVDDSIVVLENIERHLHLGKNPVQAALDGRGEIGLAAITITLVIVVVYLPVAFMSGIVGQFFREYGITVAAATLLSLLVSFTLTPMLAAYWLKSKADDARPRSKLGRMAHWITLPILWPWQKFIALWEALFTGLANLYAAILRLALKNVVTQLLVVVISVGTLYGGIHLIAGGAIASEMLPQEDDAQINIVMKLPVGTNLEATNHAARRVEQIILAETPELAKLVTQVGVGAGNLISGGGETPNSAVFTLKLVDKNDRARSVADVIAALRPALQQVPSASFTVSGNSALGSSATQLRLLGPDNDTLVELAAQAEAVIRTVPGVVDLSNTGADRSPELQIVIDRQRATDLGLYTGQIGVDLRTAVNGKEVGAFTPAGGSDELPLILRLAEADRANTASLMQLPLGYYQGRQLSLGQVSEVVSTQAPGSQERLDRQPSMLIEFGVAQGYGAADVANEVEQALRAQIDFPAGYDLEFVGLTDAQRDAFSQLGFAMLLSVVLIYMLLVALYQSWLQPLAILFSLPVAAVGALGGLYLTGNSLNIMSLLGVIMLIGIVAKNAILLVDYTNTLREEHGTTDIKAALVEAGRVRLRPILMTVLAIVFALLPLLFGSGAGAEMRAPIAAVLIGGNISSTLLTLLLVPVMYYFFEWLSAAIGRLKAKISSAPAIIPAEAAGQ